MDTVKTSKDHLKLSVEKLPEMVLLPGDPARVYEIASFLTDVEEVGNNRGYITLTGKYRGLPLAVCSSGMGGPATEIAVVELNRHGVRTIIRIGTSGGLAKELTPGDLVVLSSCIRYSGTANLFVPENFPAVADYRLLTALVSACDKSRKRYHVGIGLSVDSFYATKPKLFGEAFPSAIAPELEGWRNSGALQIDMEAATLFVLSSLLGITAGAICTVGSNIPLNIRPEEPPSNERAIECACEAALLFSGWKKASERDGREFRLPPLLNTGDDRI